MFAAGDVYMQTDIFEMKAGVSRTGGAGKLPRTQTVSVQLDPKLRYLSEIAARRQRRTISSFIEWALETALDNLYLTDPKGNANTIGQMTAHLWDVEPADRFVKLAVHYPDLLNHHEEMVWKLIKRTGFLERRLRQNHARVELGSHTVRSDTRKAPRVLGFVQQSRSRGAPKSELPTWIKKKYVPKLEPEPDGQNRPIQRMISNRKVLAGP